jgi:hypothetical protein
VCRRTELSVGPVTLRTVTCIVSVVSSRPARAPHPGVTLGRSYSKTRIVANILLGVTASCRISNASLHFGVEYS